MDRDESTQPSLPAAYREMRRQRQADLLAKLSALPAATNYDTAIEAIRLFRQYLLADTLGDEPDWDPQLAQRLNAALAMALTALAGAIDARDREAAIDIR